MSIQPPHSSKREPTDLGVGGPDGDRCEDSARDRVFATPMESVPRFEFDERVVAVFDDMISRSVPCYREAVFGGAAWLAARVRETLELELPNEAPRTPRVLDLGASTGASTHAFLEAFGEGALQLVALDYSAPMCERLRERFGTESRVEVVEADLSEWQPPECDGVISNYTLQFLSPSARALALDRLSSALRLGGYMVLTEKLRAPDATSQGEWDERYADFKRSQGYSELEIAQKREALEGYLVPMSEQEWVDWLAARGLQVLATPVRWEPFVSFVAVKRDVAERR